MEPASESADGKNREHNLAARADLVHAWCIISIHLP